MDQPLISVIVPIYNAELYIRQCIDSIINQTYRNLEIILVDDGSPDNCPAICDLYASKDDRVRVIHKENGGQAKAKNIALDIASGDYIAFVDSDDWLELSAYEEMISFSLNQGLDIVYCVPNEITNERISGTRYHYYPDKTVCDARLVLIRMLKNEISSESWLSVCRKHCWEGIRFPEGRIFEDIATSYLLLTNAERPVGFIDQPLYNYRINMMGTTQSRKHNARYHFFLSLKERYEYAQKNELQAVDKACVLAARFALGTYLDYHVNSWVELEPFMKEVMDFLTQHKKNLLFSKSASFFEKAAMFLYYYLRPLFCRIYSIYNKVHR